MINLAAHTKSIPNEPRGVLRVIKGKSKMNKTAEAKVIPLVDETGAKLPKNIAKQFRDVQGGVEYLKEAADDIRIELKTVNKSLGSHTTNLKDIVSKVNLIEKRQIEHMEITKNSLEEIKKFTGTLADVLMDLIKMNISKDAKAKARSTKKKKK